jgi:hypothetical protein
MLLARLGYPEINAGRKFAIVIGRKGAEPLRKQVDVFAKDDEDERCFTCSPCSIFLTALHDACLKISIFGRWREAAIFMCPRSASDH